MSGEWMFDAQLLMMDVPTVDEHKLTGQARFGLPMPITMFDSDEEEQTQIVAVMSEVRCRRGDPWFTGSGIIIRPDVLPILEHGHSYGLGVEVPTSSYNRVVGDLGFEMHNPVVTSAMAYRRTRRKPAFEGACLTLIAP